jgi:hypothetical protein
MAEERLLTARPYIPPHLTPTNPTLPFISLEVASRLFFEPFMQLTMGAGCACLLALSNGGCKTAQSKALTPIPPPPPPTTTNQILPFMRLDVARHLFYELFMQLYSGSSRACLLALSNGGGKTA